jgi:hypothetical protein
VGGEDAASAAGMLGVEGWDQKRGSVSLRVRVGAVRVGAGCAREMPPTAMSPGCIGWQTEAKAAPGLVVGGTQRCGGEGRGKRRPPGARGRRQMGGAS